jgi:hypothetical protein
MTQDSGEKETSKSFLEGSQDSSQSHRRVAKTFDVNSPELKKIRKLLQIESETKAGKKVTKTLLEVPLPQIEKAQPACTASNTMLEADLTVIEQLEPYPIKSQTEPDAESVSKAKPLRVEQSRQFVAKTLLDHSVLADTLKKYAARKSDRAAEEARDRASQPAVEFHPVDSKKLAQSCAWRWNDDGQTDRVRHCPNCQTQAYNFDGLELAEAEALILTRENKRNPTLYKRADGKFMTQDCPVQVKKKKKLVLFSIVAASVVLAFLTMAILAPPPPQNQVNATVDVTEQQPETDTGAAGGEDAKTAQDAAVDVQKNSDGTRKRPTFGPEDVQSYWE